MKPLQVKSPLLRDAIAFVGAYKRAPSFEEAYELTRFAEQGGVHRLCEALSESATILRAHEPIDKARLAAFITSDLSNLVGRAKTANTRLTWADYQAVVARTLYEQLP